MRFFVCLYIILFFFFSSKIQAQPEDFKLISQQFVEAIETMDLPPLELDYLENLSNIQEEEVLLKQEKTFKELRTALEKINTNNLSESERIDFNLMRVEIANNLFRINLGKTWQEEKPDSIPTTCLADVPNGKLWYEYFLYKWVDVNVKPGEIYDFGLQEIERVKNKMKNIQIASGMDSLSFRKHLNNPDFFYNNPTEILQAYKNKKEEVDEKITGLFPGLNSIPNVSIKEYKEESSIEVPGFYRRNENTLYFNYFNKPYSKRQIGWLYTHEGVPGHHYQIKYAEKLPLSGVQQLVSSSCYKEGWAAYIEEIGNEIGAYKDIYDEYGKWEWDLIRSVRVAMDVGLNYHGWSDERALEFWQQHIQEQDHLAKREIKRMKRLQYGDIPFFTLERHLGMTGFKEIYNIPYTQAKRKIDNPNQRLNLVLPQSVDKAPLLIWIGGGAWTWVNRNREMNIARNFAKDGIAVASVGHRLSMDWTDSTAVATDIQHPNHVEDIAAATKWLIENAGDYNYDTEHIFVGGFSSGAHVSAMLALDDSFLKAHGLNKENIKGVIPVGGAYDIPHYHQVLLESRISDQADGHIHSVFGDTEKQLETASATSYLHNLSAPMLLISDTSLVAYTKVFEEAIQQTNFQELEVHHANLSHGDLWTDLGNPTESKYRHLLINFINRHSELERKELKN